MVCMSTVVVTLTVEIVVELRDTSRPSSYNWRKLRSGCDGSLATKEDEEDKEGWHKAGGRKREEERRKEGKRREGEDLRYFLYFC